MNRLRDDHSDVLAFRSNLEACLRARDSLPKDEVAVYTQWLTKVESAYSGILVSTMLCATVWLSALLDSPWVARTTECNACYVQLKLKGNLRSLKPNSVGRTLSEQQFNYNYKNKIKSMHFSQKVPICLCW